MPVVDFHLAPSRQYLLIFGAIVGASMLILLGLPIPLWLKLIVTTVVLVHGFRVCRRYALLRDKLSITSIRHSDGRWIVQNQEGAFAAQLQRNSTVTTVVMLLHFRVAGKMLPLKSVIFRDSLSADDFRQLLVILNS